VVDIDGRKVVDEGSMLEGDGSVVVVRGGSVVVVDGLVVDIDGGKVVDEGSMLEGDGSVVVDEGRVVVVDGKVVVVDGSVLVFEGSMIVVRVGEGAVEMAVVLVISDFVSPVLEVKLCRVEFPC